jgi:hypothetical protein
MRWDRFVARGLMGMDEAAWAHHANPLSGWTRAATTPVLFLALWSHVWIGWWALVPVAATALWLRINPSLFPPPQSTAAWMTRGVLGERLWLDRAARPIPAHHARAAMVIKSISLAFLATGLWGLRAREFWAAFLGWHGAALAKFWFVDRMAWLYDDVARAANHGPGN